MAIALLASGKSNLQHKYIPVCAEKRSLLPKRNQCLFRLLLRVGNDALLGIHAYPEHRIRGWSSSSAVFMRKSLI
jgi:hypothetical protein